MEAVQWKQYPAEWYVGLTLPFSSKVDILFLRNISGSLIKTY